MIFSVLFSYFLILGLIAKLMQYQCFIFSDIRDYCTDEVFQVKCDRDEVILMEYAMYGRMQSGTCISDNFGYIGPSCARQVLMQMDALCSGRRECSVEIKDSSFPGYRPCHKDLKSYLEASFTCLPGG